MSAHEVFTKYCSAYVLDTVTGRFFEHSGSLPLDDNDAYLYGLCQGLLTGLFRGRVISFSEYISCCAYLRALRFGMIA